MANGTPFDRALAEISALGSNATATELEEIVERAVKAAEELKARNDILAAEKAALESQGNEFATKVAEFVEGIKRERAADAAKVTDWKQRLRDLGVPAVLLVIALGAGYLALSDWQAEPSTTASGPGFPKGSAPSTLS